MTIALLHIDALVRNYGGQRVPCAEVPFAPIGVNPEQRWPFAAKR